MTKELTEKVIGSSLVSSPAIPTSENTMIIKNTTPGSPTRLATTTAPKAPSINELPRNFEFENDTSAPLSQIKVEQKYYFDEPFQLKNQVSTNMPSAPPITEIESCYNPSITPFEMNSIKATLREIKMSVHYSKSTNGEERNLTTLLEKLYSIVKAARLRISQSQANEINEEMKKIMCYRKKIKYERHGKQLHKEATPTGCFLTFLVIVMLLRSILDVSCVIFISIRLKTLEPMSTSLLAVTLIGWVFTCFILTCYCFKRAVRRLETFYCILWTMLYGIVSTLSIVNSEDLIIPAICGYVSMITCILQGCFKCCCNQGSNTTNKSQTKDTMLKMDNLPIDSCGNVDKRDIEMNKNNSLQDATKVAIDVNDFSNKCKSTNKRESADEENPSPSAVGLKYSNDDQDSRIIAVNNLETTITNFLIQINGPTYLYQERFSSTPNSYIQIGNDDIYNKTMAQNVRTSNNTYYHDTSDSHFLFCCNSNSGYNDPYSSNDFSCINCCNCSGNGSCCDNCGCCENDIDDCCKNCCEDDCGESTNDNSGVCCDDSADNSGGCCVGDSGGCEGDSGDVDGNCGDCDADCGD